MNPFTYLPHRLRGAIYVGYLVVGLVLKILSTIWLEPDPDWLTKSLKTLAYLSPLLAITAASNLGKSANRDSQPSDPAELGEAANAG